MSTLTPQFLLRFERNAERSVAGALQARGAAPVYERMGPEEFPDDEVGRIVVVGIPFSQASNQMGFSAQRVPFFNHYRGQVSVEIRTRRDDAGSALHRAWLGLVRAYFCDANGGLTLFPYDVLEVEEAAGNTTYVKDGERDRSTLVFNLQILIPGALMDTSVKEPVSAPV